MEKVRYHQVDRLYDGNFLYKFLSEIYNIECKKIIPKCLFDIIFNYVDVSDYRIYLNGVRDMLMLLNNRVSYRYFKSISSQCSRYMLRKAEVKFLRKMAFQKPHRLMVLIQSGIILDGRAMNWLFSNKNGQDTNCNIMRYMVARGVHPTPWTLKYSILYSQPTCVKYILSFNLRKEKYIIESVEKIITDGKISIDVISRIINLLDSNGYSDMISNSKIIKKYNKRNKRYINEYNLSSRGNYKSSPRFQL